MAGPGELPAASEGRAREPRGGCWQPARVPRRGAFLEYSKSVLGFYEVQRFYYDFTNGILREMVLKSWRTVLVRSSGESPGHMHLDRGVQGK